jgi:hypothetical protein
VTSCWGNVRFWPSTAYHDRQEPTRCGPLSLQIIGAIILIFSNMETEYRPEKLLVEYTAVLGINEIFSIVHQMPEEVPYVI